MAGWRSAYRYNKAGKAVMGTRRERSALQGKGGFSCYCCVPNGYTKNVAKTLHRRSVRRKAKVALHKEQADG